MSTSLIQPLTMEVDGNSKKRPTIFEMASALAKCQGAITNPKKSSDNPFFHSKYAELSEVWDACRKPLSDNGLCLIQLPEVAYTGEVVNIEERGQIKQVEACMVTVTSFLIHSSGERIESVFTVRSNKTDVQGVGSAITYARRYAMMSILGIAPEDDDANGASRKAPTPKQQDQSQSQAPQAQEQNDQKCSCGNKLTPKDIQYSRDGDPQCYGCRKKAKEAPGTIANSPQATEIPKPKVSDKPLHPDASKTKGVVCSVCGKSLEGLRVNVQGKSVYISDYTAEKYGKPLCETHAREAKEEQERLADQAELFAALEQGGAE
jgi:hypothetical protein